MINRLLIFMLMFAVVACGNNADKGAEGAKADSKIKSEKVSGDNPVNGDAFISSSLGDATGLIYNITSDSASHDIASKIYNGLVEYDKDINIVGDLAESWDITDEGKTIVFHLRKDVRWHDGEPFTADDVEFTYKFMIDDKTPTSYDADFRLVKSFEVLDKYTVRIEYGEAYAPALISWSMPVLPKHLLEGVDVTKSPLLREPVGTGPYKFKEWKAGESITLEANEDYFKGRPYLDRFVMRVIPDSATTFLELLDGAIDMTGLTPLQWTRQTDANKQFTEQYDKYDYLSFGYTYVAYNELKKPFDDKRVRQALTYATPKADIIKGILFDLGIPAHGPYKPGTIWYNDNVKKYDYNPEKALELLAEAGYTDSDSDGFLDKDGKRFEFELITNQGNSVRTKICETLQQSWEKIGIKVSIRVLEWATFINEYVDKQKFDALVLGWNITNDPDLYDVWYSGNCGARKLNFICYKNEELDRLLIEGRKVFDPEKRKEYYHKAQEILAEDQPYTFLYVPYSLVAISKRFENVYTAPAGLTHNQDKWWVKKGNQKYHFER
ncbi:extracellular solute-binding protein family 5 [Denitrovibrio acetiphilus DSM 12809]|uniref:Extracellular solute-binding protein family 5 n=1 Tax=Denitrovibrio acetiphilus (strain DSM 12809 / NBRC 114555 / N2460) TaxID=522772 RepID=D4H726_DENA2|nr:peptide-binding protein [Denitrovibrio acetiphilus]ADD69730.1 extracellular solute-binding protein family 5 [Denitrovibrio acetiphilus DSM 12809]